MVLIILLIIFSNGLVEFKEEEYYLMCLPDNILYQFTKIFLHDYEEYRYNYKIFNSLNTYKILQTQNNVFPNISFKFEKYVFSLNQENAFWPKYLNEYYYFFINKYPCPNFVFGLKFLELFDISEFNLENGDINLYLEKNINYMTNEINTKKLLLNLIFIFLL